MKLTTAIRVIAAAVCGLFLLTGCSQPDKGQQPQKELTKMTMLISSDAPDCVRSAAEEFINRAAFYSDGELEISLSESQQVETILESSEAEFAFVSNEELVSSVPELETLNLPFYFKHEDYQFSALNAERTKKRLNELLSAVYPMEVQMATVCGYEDLAADAQVDLTDFRKRYPLAVKTSYFSDQLQEEIGAREIVSDNPFQLLLDGGAEIAQASLSQVIKTVQQGQKQAQELVVFTSAHKLETVYLLIGQDVMESLDEKQQAAVEQAAVMACGYCSTLAQQQRDQQMEQLQELGVQVYRVNLEKYFALLGDIYQYQSEEMLLQPDAELDSAIRSEGVQGTF